MENRKKPDLNLYLGFFNESDAAMAILDSEGKILAANRKYENLIDSLSPSRSGSSVPARLPADTTLFSSSLLPLFTGKHNYAFFEYPLQLRRNGEEIIHWFNVHAWRIKDLGTESHGPLIGLSLEDNTLVKQEEKRLLQDKIIAEKAMEAKAKFLASMSHEIRTPIQTIIGMTELLFDTRLDHEQAEYSRQVKFSAEVLLSLVNDILDYTKIEAGKMNLEHISFNLEQIVEQAVEMIALEAHKKGLCIATSIPLDTSIIIRGDPGKFRQVVINLVKNAVKFTDKGSIIVSLALAELAGKEAIRVSVADTGIGVNEEARKKLFSNYMQSDVSNTRRFGGTGLGLAISRELVELMGGRIEMVPNEGGGSVFRFDIPLERSPGAGAPLPPPERNGKLKILVVDDMARERSITASYLRDLGYTDISQAESGETALGMMKSAAGEGRAFQICFIDMVMPVMDGWRLAAEIHNDSSIRQSDLVLMVPHGLMGAETKMTLLKWFKANINKPIKRRSLAETISAVLNEPQELEAVPDIEPVDAGRKPVEKNPLILIAEDHEVNRKLYSIILEKLGYTPLLAVDGQDVVEKAENNNVALVLMDIQMPKMNGYEATETLRKKGFKKPIIAVTASAFSDERELCLKAGIDDILIKPVKSAELGDMLCKWIKNSSAEMKAEKPGPDAIPHGTGVVFDAREMFETFYHNDELAVSLLSRFIEQTRSQLEMFPDLEKAEDWESARREAHRIKGAALTMSGAELGREAARLELAYKNINRDEMKAAYTAICIAFDRFKKEAEALIRSRS